MSSEGVGSLRAGHVSPRVFGSYFPWKALLTVLHGVPYSSTLPRPQMSAWPLTLHRPSVFLSLHFCIWSQALDPTLRYKPTQILYPISYHDGKLRGHLPAHAGAISLPGSEYYILVIQCSC